MTAREQPAEERAPAPTARPGSPSAAGSTRPRNRRPVAAGPPGTDAEPGAPEAIPDSHEESLDLTKTEHEGRLAQAGPLATTLPFNPRRLQEMVRTWVAVAVIAAVVVETLAVTFAYIFGDIPTAELSPVTTAVITPLVGIAGTVLGFYFGSHRTGN
jgi:hypothetical protein